MPNYADSAAQHTLTKGLVITIEPIIAAGTGDVTLDQHTIVITRGEPVLLTAA